MVTVNISVPLSMLRFESSSRHLVEPNVRLVSEHLEPYIGNRLAYVATDVTA